MNANAETRLLIDVTVVVQVRADAAQPAAVNIDAGGAELALAPPNAGVALAAFDNGGGSPNAVAARAAAEDLT